MAVGMFAVVCLLFAVGRPLEPLCYGRGEIRLVDDVVSVEHGPRLPAAEPHDLTLGDPAAPKVADRGAPEVMD